MKEQNTFKNNRPCEQQEYTVTPHDLPLCCPLPEFRLWDAHPRVYMPIETTGREVCPYCGAIYLFSPTGVNTTKSSTVK